MRRLAVIVLAAALVAPSVAAAETVPLLVGFDELPDVDEGGTFQGADVDQVLAAVGALRVLPDDPEAFRDRVRDDPDIAYVEADRRVRVAYTPDDPRYPDQYGPQQIHAPAAWDRTLGQTTRTVCLVDTGVRYTHEDLADRYEGGYDFVHGDDDPWDDNGHGTMVAGVAVAGLDNGVGIAGTGNVAYKAAKALNASGVGWVSDVADATTWCADHGGDVIGLSLGTESSTNTLKSAVDYAWDQGAIPVAAAGNDGPCTDCIDYPAAYASAIAVTCTDADEQQCGFSSQGPEAELAAPGADVLSTCFASDADYCSASGTSLSAPHVVGTAALAWTVNTSATAEAIRGILQEEADDLGADGRDHVYGYGLLNASGAVHAVGDLPWACFDVAPTEGDTSTVFAVDATCSTDPSTATADLQARWDWTGDGRWDTDWSTDKTRSHSYGEGGDHTIVVQVRDADGRTDRTAKTVVVDDPPSACLTGEPRHGDLTTTYRFDASCSDDDRTHTGALEVRWDVDADGDWDTDWGTDKTIERRYDARGDQTVRVQVRDGVGQTGVAEATVTVHVLCSQGTCVG